MMSTIRSMLTLALVIAFVSFLPGTVSAQTCDSTRSKFVDLNGDGFNDKALDHDGDGIPNGQDPDFIKGPKDGSGAMHEYQKGEAVQAANQGETQPMVQTRAQNRLEAGDGAGLQEQAENVITTQTQSRVENKGDFKEQFQNRAQAFTQTQTMSQVRSQQQITAGEAGSSSSGAGTDAGPKSKGKAGDK